MQFRLLPSRSVQIASSICALLFLLANSGNPPNGRTGAPFDSNCTDCHSPSNPNFGGNVSISGLPATILPGQAYTLVVSGSATAGSPSVAGFQLVMVDGSNANAGTLVAGADSGVDNAGGRNYVEHRGAKSVSGNSVTWVFNWTAPMTAGSNLIKAYAALNFCDGTGGTSGDLVVNTVETAAFQPLIPLSANASVNNNVSCNGGSDGSATVIASGGQMPYSYAWSTGGSGATRNDLPAGTHTITITDGSNATSTTMVTISQPSAITASASNSGIITCANPSITITASASGGTGNLAYNWSNGASGASATVSNPATYFVTVTDANGCTETSQTVVTANTTPPTINTIGGTVDCANPATQLSASSTSTGTYMWSGPSGFASNMQNPTVSLAGNYTVTITNAQGCTNSGNATVTSNTSPPTIMATGGSIDCLNPFATLGGSSTTPNVSYNWTGPNSFFSAIPNPTVSESGTYSLTVTGQNGCTNTVDVDVIDDSTIPNISATGATLNCTNTSVMISGNSTTAGVSYAWVGPNGFSSTDQNPTVNTPGVYTLTVTAPNGCTSTEDATVNSNSSLPNISASGGTLNCTINSVMISGNSTTMGASYSWTGPNGFSSTNQNPSVTDAGTYTLTVTAPNGCSTSEDVIVDTDSSIPNISTAGATLSCSVTSATLTGNSTSTGASFSWSGPNGFTSTDQNPTVNTGGVYTLTVIGTNGCTSTMDATVSEDISIPDVSATGGILDCSTNSVQLSANSTTAGVSYAWSDANGFTSTNQNPSVSTDGAYTVVVIAPNGCTSSQTVDVTNDAALPDVSISGNAVLTCNTFTSELLAASTTPNVTYDWGNGNTNSILSVSQAGIYTVSVTAPNGCTSSESYTVTSNLTEPGASATGGTITCTTSSVQLQGSSPTANVTYEWTGPSGSVFQGQSPTVSETGDYIVVVTDPINGCTSTATTTVTPDAGIPDAAATGGTLDCNNASVTLNGSSTTPGVNFQWIDPSGNPLTGTSPTVSLPGDYTFIVTNPANGCSATTSTTVILDGDLPTFSSGVSGSITCANPSVQLNATPDPGQGTLTYAWSGSTGFTSTEMSPFVGSPGNYTVIVTGTNGCSSSQSVTVNADLDVPFISIATPSMINCVNSCVLLDGTIMNAVNQAWSGPGFSSTDEDVTVCAPGNYTLIATNSSGCTVESTVEVLEDFSSPSVTADDGILTCLNSIIQLDAMVTGTVTSVNWTGPNGFSSSNSQPMVQDAGTYTVVVTGTNGCTSSTQAVVTSDIQEPQITLASPGTITCTDTCSMITASSDIPGTSFEWLPSFGNPTSGNTFTYCASMGYTEVEAFAPNGCSVLMEIMVNIDTNEPNLTLESNGAITCSNSSVTLLGQTDTNADITWTDPSGNNSMQSSIMATAGGIYTATSVSQANGCTATQTIEVVVDTMVTASIQSVTAPSCFDTQDGIVTIQLNDSLVTIDDLMSGAYVVDFTASNGCMTTVSYIIPITPEILLTTNGGPWIEPASIVPTVMGGNPGYSFNWQLNGQTVSTDSIPTNLMAGSYTVDITDANGCMYEFGPFVVDEMVNINEPFGAGAFDVFPSPTHALLNVKHSNHHNGQKIGYQLFNSTGALIFFEKNADKVAQFDLSTYPEGMYLLRVFDLENPTIARTVPVIRN